MSSNLVREAWKGHDGSSWASLIGQHVRVSKGPVSWVGVLEDISAWGVLMVKLDGNPIYGDYANVAHATLVEVV